MKNYLLMVVLLFMGVVSCQDVGQEKIDDLYHENVKPYVSDEYEKQLKVLAIYFGEVFQNEDAIKELYSFAENKKYGGEVHFNLRLLFDNKNPHGKQKSAIVNRFFENGDINHRIDEGFNIDDLIDFINENNIVVRAPYLAENFKQEDVNEITVSWWTQEMDDLHKDDPDWKGETPGFKFDIKKSNKLITFRTTGAESNFEQDYVMTNDEYALENPTVVFGSFDFELDDPYYGVPPSTGGGGYLPPPTTLWRCPDLTATSRFTLSMPEWRLTSNVRSWPDGNRVHLWVVTGDFSRDDKGDPVLSSNVAKVLAEYWISRSDANDGVWHQAGTIVPRIQYETENLYLIWGVRRTHNDLSVEADLKFKNIADSSLKFKFALNQPEILRFHDNMELFKCDILEDNFHSSGDVLDANMNLLTRTIEGHKYPVQRMGQADFVLRSRHQ